jgi:hypothetical protein
MLVRKIPLIKLFFLFLSLNLASCGGGGGGGGGDFLGAARVFIEARPVRIDTGDRMQVSIDISQIHPDGILLKIKFPVGLRYVQSSSNFTTNQETFDATPIFNVRDEEIRYLVYAVKRSSFGEREKGKLNLELQGVSVTESGEIQVDPDVDNPLVPNSEEFSASDPDFSPEDGLGVAVS